MRLLVNIAIIATAVAIAYARPQLEKQETFEALPNGCPVSWDIHHLLPHESDCRLFYYCVRGEKVLRECSNPNTHFNPIEQVCDWPENAGCQLSDGGGDSEEFEGSGDPDIEDEDDEESEILPNGCPADFHVHKLLPHETECNKFYYCVFGDKVLRECAPGTYFNYKIQVCDWPQNVDCASSGGGNGAGGEQEPAPEDPGSSEGPGGEWLDNGCPSDWHVHHLLPHETDCALFYYCVRGEKVLRECAPGTHFNPVIQVCDWPENAGCGSGGGNTDSPGNGSGEDNGVTDGPGNGSGENNGVTDGPGNGSGENNGVTDGPGNGSEESNEVTDGPGNGSGENPGAGSGEWLENGCPADWDVHQLLPHENDCRLFYYCVHGELVLRECQPGEHFNPVLQVCDWPENAGCANGGGNTDSPGNGSGEDNEVTDSPGNGSGEDSAVTDSPGNGSGENPGAGSGEWLENGCPADWDVHHLLPHEYDCNKFYYCVHGELALRECDSGLHFNPVEQVCDWPESAGCANGGGNTDSPGNGSGEDNEVTDSPGNGSGEDNEITDSPGNGSGENPGAGSGEWLENGCPADWDVHHLLPHENDCNKFYYCVHGELALRECDSGLHFNPVEQVCDWPESAGCANGGGNTDSPGNGSGEDNEVTDSPGNGSGEDSAVTDSPGNGSGENPGSGSGEWLENGCPADWDVHHLLPHENDCNKFYYCVHGELALRECYPGLHFNPVEQVCDWPESAGCANGGANTDSPGNGSGEDNEVTDSPGNGSGEDNEVTDSPGNGSGENPGAGSGEWLENGCPADWDVHHLLPHENDCNKFYYCVHGELALRECYPGLHFNPVEQVCDWPESAGCANGGGNTDSPGNGSGEDNEVTDSPGNGSGEDNEVTDSPGNGSGEDNEVTDSPGNGSGENPGAGSGEWLENGCPADWDVHHLLPHENDCNKFYYCVHGELALRECYPGLHFNPVEQVCDWPESAGCANGGGNTDSPGNGSGEDNEVTDSPGNGSGEDNEVTDSPGNGSGENPGAGSGEWLENGCPADWDVHHLLPHENDCNKFYYCVHGNLVTSECPPGLHFNPVEQVCDWPESAGCASGGGNTDSPGNGSEEDNNVTDSPGSDSGEDNEVTEGPGNGSGENPGTESGEWLENGCPADWNIHHLLPHDNDCGKFYYCVHGNLVESECRSGLHFNPTLQVCDWPENAGCENGGSNTESPGGESEEDSVVTEAPDSNSGEDNNVTDSPGNNSEENSEEATEAPGNGSGEDTEEGSGSEEEAESPQDLVCANDCNVGHWAHETDCDKFWKCKDGEAVLGVCSEGLHFNPVEQTCDFICNVNCVRETIQATVGENGLKLFVPWDKIDDKLIAAYKVLGM